MPDEASIDRRVKERIDALGLKPHPEGGYYREVFRSKHLVKPMDRREERSALTAIYFLLAAGQCSRWHRVLSDEVWAHLEGDAIELFFFEEQGRRLGRIQLGQHPVPDTTPMHTVLAGVWTAAVPKGKYSLAGCMVGPGFDFEDFRLAADDPDTAELIRRQGPEFGRYL
ncbi:cupin domain-containing protein [bacterium]|nr:cupin domain-containing protein [bacterium]